MGQKRSLYPLLAELLEYPRPGLREKALRARNLLAEIGTGHERASGIRHQASGDGGTRRRGDAERGDLPLPRGEGRGEGLAAEASTPGGQNRAEDGLEAASLMEQFASFAENTSPDRIEEIYTATFDLNPTCYPYVGYHLFGDDPQRAELMVKLQEGYREASLNTGGELPDHVALMLRYLAALDDPELVDEMVELLMAPALEKMAGLLGDDNPYRNLVRGALLLVRSAVCEVR